MLKLEPDGWYFGVECIKCRELFAFAEAPTPDECPNPVSSGSELACPHCHTRHTYRGSEVLRLQGPERTE